MATTAEEELVEYGTPLEPYEEDEVPAKKPVRPEDQIVTDEKGRRRFHGAFTGGFSAGFYNTVGSVEGWTPKSFVSSRANRADQRASRPEDFMDDDDLGQFGIAPRSIQVTKDFEAPGKGSRKRPPEGLREGPIPGEPVLETLIVPAVDSIGAKVLRKLGWKPGQGIGPRIKNKTKTHPKSNDRPSASSHQQKVYGCLPPPTVESDDSDGDFTRGKMFAPDDIDLVQFTPKNDLHGIGYRGLDRTTVLTGSRAGGAPVVDRAKKLAIAGEAFGVGVYEEDDETIYTTEDMSQYDFTLDDAEHPNEHAKSGPKKTTSSITGALEGFHISTRPKPAKKIYPPPTLPKDFRPFCTRFSDADADAHRESGRHGRHSMSAPQRAATIRDQLPATSSVFDILSPADRARLEMAKKFTTQGSEESTNESVPQTSQLLQTVPSSPSPSSSRTVAYTVDGQFRPFSQEPEKQQRFEVYLKLAGTGEIANFAKHQPASMTEWEKTREAEEFHRASILYRPLQKSISSRFVPAQISDSTSTTSGLEIQATTPKSDMQIAADSKSFGKQTRQRDEWHPDRILCRRFNVPNPYPDSTDVGVVRVKQEKITLFERLAIMPQKPESALVKDSTEDVKCSQMETTGLDKETVAPLTLNKPLEEPSTKEGRPPIDLFKAIFQDSEPEEDSSSDLDSSSVNPEVVKVIPSSPKAPSKSDAVPQTKTDPPSKGIFTNIDFDRLARQAPSVTTRQPKDVEAAGTSSEANDIRQEFGCALPPSRNNSRWDHTPSRVSEPQQYGPSLPPTPTTYATTRISELTHLKSSSKKKRDKHKNKSKKKTKHKKKHHHSKSSSSDLDYSSSDDDLATKGSTDDARLLRDLKGVVKRLK